VSQCESVVTVFTSSMRSMLSALLVMTLFLSSFSCIISEVTYNMMSSTLNLTPPPHNQFIIWIFMEYGHKLIVN